MPSHRFSRSVRVADLIKHELASMLLSEIKDPRVSELVTVVEVKVSRDLQHARIYVSVYGDEHRKNETMEGLASARGFIRTELGHRLNMRRIPDLKFELDRRLDAQDEIGKLIAGPDSGKDYGEL